MLPIHTLSTIYAHVSLFRFAKVIIIARVTIIALQTLILLIIINMIIYYYYYPFYYAIALCNVNCSSFLQHNSKKTTFKWQLCYFFFATYLIILNMFSYSRIQTKNCNPPHFFVQ